MSALRLAAIALAACMVAFFLLTLFAHAADRVDPIAIEDESGTVYLWQGRA